MSIEITRFVLIALVQTIIPLLIDTLCNPFATAAPLLLIATARTLQSILLVCWPRMNLYAGETLKGVSVCWCRIQDGTADERLEDVQTALRDVLKLLRAVLASDSQALEDIETVLESDSRLKGLIVGI